MRTNSLAAVAFAGALAACGGATTGGTNESSVVSGTVSGTSFTRASDVALLGFGNSEPHCTNWPCTTVYSGQKLTLFITNRSEFTCTVLQGYADSLDGPQYANWQVLQLGVLNPTADLAAGTYPIVATLGSSGASAEFVTETSTCGAGLDVGATSGMITLTQVSATGVSGSYDLTFGTQGAFAGSFNVPICDFPDASTGWADAAAPVCQQ